jgi:Fic family protein
MVIGELKHVDQNVEGVVEMMLDATRHYDRPLTMERLLAWHASLFPIGRSGMRRIRAGAWRDNSGGLMQVLSGPVGKERIHFEAPAAETLDEEVDAFVGWFNGETETDWVAKAGLAHFWFVTIHPFDDGNGRIARAIADMALARSEQSSQRFYSMSTQIRQERAAYYDILEEMQKGTTDITPWMNWFLGCLSRAIEGAQAMLATVLTKARFWESLVDVPVNDRQRLVLKRLLDGFEGNLTTSKWAKRVERGLAAAGVYAAHQAGESARGGLAEIATLRNRAARKLRVPAAEQSRERRTLSMAGRSHSEIRGRCFHRSRAGDRQHLHPAIDRTLCGSAGAGVPGID